MNNKFKIGDVVSRKKYGNDILFKIDKIVGNKVFLKGLEIRLYADANIEDIALSGIPKKKEEITPFTTKAKKVNLDSAFGHQNKETNGYKFLKVKETNTNHIVTKLKK